MRTITFKTFFLLFTLTFIFSGCINSRKEDKSTEQTKSVTLVTPESFGWNLGAQLWTFRKFTVAEAFSKMQNLGLKYAELYNGQEIGNGIEGKIDFKMSPELRNKVLELAASHHIKIVQFGVISAKSEEDWKQLFEFAKAMGIQVITSEPKENEMDMVNKLATVYDIKIAIHNHPQPSSYWNPDAVLAAVKDHDMIGSCADIGHWKRSGLDPVECMQKLEGKIFTIHVKDIEKAEKSAEDVIWGTGVCNFKAVMEEAKRQNFKGTWSIEYESHPEDPVPYIEKSLDYFNKTVKEL
jgi:sugar phosphate isomerase/epimerase